tara:strand:+ start:615 stop:806 length:192 start_codon:yes stop_codon:yes gene_type:complete
VLLDHLVLTGLQVVVEEEVKIPLGEQVEDREVLTLEEEVEEDHLNPKKVVIMECKTLAVVVED